MYGHTNYVVYNILKKCVKYAKVCAKGTSVCFVIAMVMLQSMQILKVQCRVFLFLHRPRLYMNLLSRLVKSLLRQRL